MLEGDRCRFGLSAVAIGWSRIARFDITVAARFTVPVGIGVMFVSQCLFARAFTFGLEPSEAFGRTAVLFCCGLSCWAFRSCGRSALDRRQPVESVLVKITADHAGTVHRPMELAPSKGVRRKTKRVGEVGCGGGRVIWMG